MADETLELETFLPYRLYRLADLVSREFAAVYKDRLGLTRPEWRVLAGLGQHGTLTAKTLGEQSAMHKTKVSRAVAELEKRHWLTRQTDPADRRVENLSLTRKGRAAYREMVPVALSFADVQLTRLEKADRVKLLDGILALEAAMETSRHVDT